MVRQLSLAWIALGLIVVGCSSPTESTPPPDQEVEQVFTRTIVGQAADGSETVAAYEVHRSVAGVETTAPLGKGSASADGTSLIAPQNCPSCSQGPSACNDTAVRIWDNSGSACNPSTGRCVSGASYTGNEICFNGVGNEFPTAGYCKVWNIFVGGCLIYWSPTDFKSVKTPPNINACFWLPEITETPRRGTPYPPNDSVPSTDRWTRAAGHIGLTTQRDPNCTPPN